METVPDITIDDLERVLLAGEAAIAEVRARQAAALRVLDAIQVHQYDGSRSMLEWAAARMDITHTTARDLLEVAKASAERPALWGSLRSGEATFDRTVATVKLAVTGASREVIEQSKGFDLAGVRRLGTRHRRMTRQDERDVFLEQFVAIQPTLDHTAARFWGQLPGFEARIFEKALRQRADRFNDLPGPKMRKPMRMANALVSIAQDSLYEPETASTVADPLVTVFVDGALAASTGGEAGAEVEFGPKVGPGTLERILCTGAAQTIVDGSDGLVASHATRAIPPAVRRHVAWRDGGCTIDGCRSRYRLEPHHVRHRVDGGGHEPENLTTLCWYHHHVAIHGSGYRIDPTSPPQRRRLLPPSGSDPPRTSG